VACDADDRVSQNVREKKKKKKDHDRGGGLGTRFRVGGTKEEMAQQAGHREGSKEDMNRAR
jgi:hypothetical protein